jgi:AP-1-like factor
MSKSNPGNLFNQNFDFNGIDWLAEQNNNQFDPQLFGDYREPQDNILAGDVFNNDSFFTDAFALPDFQTPASLEPSPAPAKKDLLAQIDQKQNEDEVVPAEDRSKLLNCNTIW